MIQKGGAILEKFTLRTQRGKIRLEGSDYHDLLNQLRTLDGIPEANLMDFRRGGEKVKQAILGSIAALYDAKITPAEYHTDPRIRQRRQLLGKSSLLQRLH